MSRTSQPVTRRFPDCSPQVSRRAVLGGLGSLAALFATPSLAFADTRSPKASPFGAPKPTPSRVRGGNGNFVQPTPYAVQASCGLSEDYFLTADVIVGGNDEVFPFVNHLNGGAVEAVVVTEATGALSHVHRDPSTISGWTISPISYPSSLGSVAQVAVAASPKGVFIGAVAPPDPHQNNSTLSWFSWLTSATTWAAGTTMGPGAPLEMFRAGVAPDQTPYFYGWVGSPTTINKVPNLNFTFYAYLCTAQAAPQMRPVLELNYPTATQPNISDAVLQYDISDTGGAVHGVAAVLQTTADSSEVTVYPQSGTTYASGSPLFDSGATALLWANTPGPNQWEALFTVQGGDIAYVDQNTQTDVYGFGSSLNYGDVAAWVKDGAYTFTLLADGVVSVMSQATAGGAFTLPIPLVDGVGRIYSAVTDPAESTLFAVMADDTLAVLTKDPTSGSWTQHQVHYTAAVMQEVESYNTMISILDANGVGVAGAQATIVTDRLVGMWQEPSGNTIIEPGTPVTLTTDFEGKITVSIPADELDCAILTVQALDGDNNPSGSPFVVTPHIDVANFFAGQGALTDIGQLTGPAMQAAQTASGASLFTNLGGASGAAAAASAINHIGSLGLGSQPAELNGTQSAMFDLTGSTPSFQASSNPNAFSLDLAALNAKRHRDAAHLSRHHRRHPHPVGDVGGVSDWWNSVKGDAESVFHGLRHAAIKFKKMVTTWAADTKQWTVNLIVDIGDGLDNVMTYIVKDIKTAVHAISSFFHALGADIKSAIDWLKHHVLDLLKEADGNAAIMLGWFSTAIGTSASPGPFHTALTTVENKVDDALENVEGQIDQAILDMKDAVGNTTFGGAAELPGLVAYTGSEMLKPLAQDASEVAKILKHVHANWLLNKIKKYWPGDDSGPTSISTFGPVVNDLATVFKDLVPVADSIVKLLHDSASTMFASSHAYSGATLSAWLDDLNSTLTDTITLLTDIVHTVCDMLSGAFDAMLDTLNYEIRTGGSSLIEQIFGVANLSSSKISVGHLVTLVAAYPATLAAGDNSLFPSVSGSAGRSRPGRKDKSGHRLGDGNDGWETGLGITAAVVQGIWGLNDIVVDIQTGTDPDGTKRTAPGICDWIDIFAPVLLTILQWPSAKGPNNATEYPFYGGVDTSTKWDWMLPFIIISGLAPACMGLYQKRKPAGAGTNLPAPHGVDDPFADYYGPIVQMISGIANTALGTAFNVKTSAGGASIAAGVLGNLSYMLAVLAQRYVNEAAEDGPVLIKTVVDAAGNLGAAICIAEATSIPPK